MSQKLVRTVLGLVSFLLGFAVIDSRAMETDFDSAWRDYANTQSHLEPAYRFPHARCFGTCLLYTSDAADDSVLV